MDVDVDTPAPSSPAPVEEPVDTSADAEAAADAPEAPEDTPAVDDEKAAAGDKAAADGDAPAVEGTTDAPADATTNAPADTTTDAPAAADDTAADDAALATEATEPGTPQAGPSAPSAPRRNYNRKSKAATSKADGFTAYTTAFVPGLYNVKNPAGDFVQRESNVEVVRQVSLARAKKEKEDEEARRKAVREEARRKAEEERGPREEGANGNGNGEGAEDDNEVEELDDEPQENPLSKILIIHPGSRNLRLGRASDFYPHEVPNCIARPSGAGGGSDPPVPGFPEEEEENVDRNIGYLRDYLQQKLRANKLTTDWREGQRVKAANSKAKPETIPEHNDPRRIEWTEIEDKPYHVGNDALKLPASAGWRIRYPILARKLNGRDWNSTQLLLDDITIIIQESLKTELGIKPADYAQYRVVLIVPDHGDRFYVQEMANILFNVMGFREIAIHQESYCAIFSAGMSSACVVDIGAQETSVTCVDEGTVNADTRITLSYGGDDVTVALQALLERSSFPYKDVDLSRAQDWIMLDELKIRICTLEEHLVANTPWEFYVLSEGLTKKYMLRTYDENILAPLCYFDTRMIDFDTMKGTNSIQLHSPDVDDMIKSHYDEATGAMKACTAHLFPSKDVKEETPAVVDGTAPPSTATSPAPVGGRSLAATPTPTPAPATGTNAAPTAATTTLPTPVATLVPPTTNPSAAATPAPGEEEERPKYDIPYEASKTPLDGAIAAAISLSSSENKVKTAASSILLIGGGSALKGLAPFIEDRLPSLLRQKGFPVPDVTIVPPPRNLNPKFVSWKGASVMCNLDSLSDMWLRADEFEAIGARSLKERCLFL